MTKLKDCRACFENGTQKCADHVKNYGRQIAWNKIMKKLLANRIPWNERPVPPAPDDSLKALEAWAVSQSITGTGSFPVANTWWRETHALLAKEPKSWKGFSFMPKGEVT